MRKLDAAGNTATAERTKPPYVTTAQFAALTPNDSDEAYLIADATKGVIWHFRYNAGSGSAYKWEFIGGPALWTKDAAGNYVVTSASWMDVSATYGINNPRPGDYQAEADFRWQNNSTQNPNSLQGGLAVGATTPPLTQALSLSNVAAAQVGSMHLSDEFAGIAASSDVRVRTAASTPGSSAVLVTQFTLRIRPIRVS